MGNEIGEDHGQGSNGASCARMVQKGIIRQKKGMAIMDSAKVTVRCTIDFLPDTGEFDAVVALRTDDDKWYGCRGQRFAELSS